MKLRGHFIIYGNQNDSNREMVDLFQLVVKANDYLEERTETLQRKGKTQDDIAQDKEVKHAKSRLEEAKHNLTKSFNGET